ncbi:hypothetical protein JCM11491_002368 [Sporobolomyces phaffii]
MPPIGAAPPRRSPASSPVIPACVDFIDTGPTIKRRLRSFLSRDPPPDRHVAYLESVGHEHSASRSSPISPPARSGLPRVAVPSISSTSSSPRLEPGPLRRPGVALALSVSTENLAVVPGPSPSPYTSSLASRSSSIRTSAVTSARPAPTYPLPPLPLPPPPSPQVSLETAIDANVLHRCATTYRPSEPSSYAPLHERIFLTSKGLLSGSVGSIWSLPAGHDEVVGLVERDGTKISLDDLSLAPDGLDGEEDLLEDGPVVGDGPGRPSLSTSSSSDSADRIKFLSVFDDPKPNLTTTRTTTTTRLFPPASSSSPSISPRTQTLARFEPRIEPAPRQYRHAEEKEEEEDDDVDDNESDVDVVRKTPGAFCWTPTEHLSLSKTEQDRLGALMRTKSW